MTPAEEGAAYEQLSVLGLSDTAIAKRTGTTKKRVQTARHVANSEVASAVCHRYALDLEQAAVVAEFGDDRQAVKTLTVVAKENPGQFTHVASRLRQDRELTQQRAVAVEALTEAGVTVLESSSEHPTATPLWKLCDSEDDGEITPEAHSGCPGHAAVVPEHSPDSPRYLCLDPDAYGHRIRYSDNRRPAGGAMTDEQKAERREVVENNKQWRAAEPVRREYLRGVLSRKTAPKGTLRYAVGEVLAAPGRGWATARTRYWPSWLVSRGGPDGRGVSGPRRLPGLRSPDCISCCWPKSPPTVSRPWTCRRGAGRTQQQPGTSASWLPPATSCRKSSSRS